MYRFRSGKTVTANQWREAMEGAQRCLGERKVGLSRGDLGLGHDAVMCWHEEQSGRPMYLFKLKLTSKVRTDLLEVPEANWQGPAKVGACQVAEGTQQLTGWRAVQRVVFARCSHGTVPRSNYVEFWEFSKQEFVVYVTNLEVEKQNAWQFKRLYRDRADTEKLFAELKNQWGFSGFCAKARATIELAARLLLLTYNLWVSFARFNLFHQHTKAKRSRRRFLFIGAKLVQSGRQKEVQLSISGIWAEQLRDGCMRLHDWIRTTLLQLKSILPLPA